MRLAPKFLLALAALVLLSASPVLSQCVSLTTLGSAATQNFDTLSNTAGSTTNNLTITGWFMTESGGGARDNEQYAVDTGGNLLGFLIGGRDGQGAGGAFSLKRTDDFDVSDCAATPDGNLLVLERRFSWTRGLAVRIRSVPLAAIKSGALVDGRELMFADMGSQIDNMEGVSVHRDSSGALVLTLLSDDNFSLLQRTLLLQFTLVRE